MLTLGVLVDLSVAVAGGALLLAVVVFGYKLHRGSLDQPKVHITASCAVASFPGRPQYIVVQLTNSGRRPVTLTSVLFQSGDSTGLLVTHPDNPIFDAATCFPSKQKLEEGEQTKVYLPRNEFAKVCPLPVMRFLAVDTTGKTWKSNTYPLGKSPINPIPSGSGCHATYYVI